MISSQPKTIDCTVSPSEDDRRRHAGQSAEKTHYWRILLSAALLFGGLAITVVTIQTDEEEYEDE